ncbi:hypothetical protein EC912_10285 [Luteibacter rhizovicinus]|uniref:Uncharacterized protein n=1 Tax=Luteibacter rhizovicinus TaxID=242606 RepID=A0A4R3YT88_9GAMM|nr:hypothetical protein [Luteibacter rhizovicinus]TCV95741.1 hypothetical protein EC912_10285 [Luteibacter rhizovicinus]
MRSFFRRAPYGLLRFIGRYPALKRLIVDAVYRFPALDATLRTVANRATHPEAALDVDAARMPDASRRAYERMRGGRRP